MKRSSFLLYLSVVALFTSGCGNETTINDDEASAVIEEHLESNPEYKAITFNFGEMKFRSGKDREELNKYKVLEEQGFVKMELNEQKKVFLSKDTSYVYLITLTDKAAPLVIDQGKDKATVKAVNYILDDSKPVNFVKSNNKTAKATVSLKKVGTEFYPFLDKDSNSEFITKTYKLKLKKDNGWEVD
ncbi:MAG: hypothetical protein ACYCZO_03595 [Daejeonella sp.]